MKCKICAIFALIIVTCLVLSSGCAPSCPEIGSKAPDFTLQTTDGGNMSLSDLKGSKVMVNLWSTRCVPCVSEMPHIQAIHDKWSSKGLKILAVNVNDNAQKAQSFADENGLTFTILIDSKSQMFQLFCLQQVIPITLFIDEEGILQAKKLGAFTGEEEIEKYLNSL
jgi:cytochrome c biogenesis protein CcmG/thiol:disulfide interchange protein DsbE